MRLAVDELSAILIGAGGSMLELRMQARERVLIIRGRTPDSRSVILPTLLSEMLIYALVDSCVFTIDDCDASFEMRKLARDIA